MRGLLRRTVVAAGITGLVVGAARAADGPDIGPRVPCANDCIRTPAPRVIVEVAPPEVIYRQAPAPAAVSEKPCFVHRLFHHKQQPPYVVQAAPPPVMAAPPVFVQQAVAPIAMQPFAAAPFYTQAVQPMPFAAPYAMQPVPVPVPSYALPPAAPARSSAEAELFATVTALGRLRELLSAQASSERCASSANGAQSQARAEAADPDVVRQIAELKRKIDRLQTIVVDHEDRLTTLEKKVGTPPRPEK